MKLDVVYKDELLTSFLSMRLRKLLYSVLSKGLTMHSLRHSIRDRLRLVECPSDAIDQIGGWATEGAGQIYRERYELKVCMRWMNFISA